MSREYITLHIYRAAEQIYSKNKTGKVKLYCDVNNIDSGLWGQELLTVTQLRNSCGLNGFGFDLTCDG